MMMIVKKKLPFSNEEEGGEQSSAENDGGESADDAQSAGTHSLTVSDATVFLQYFAFFIVFVLCL